MKIIIALFLIAHGLVHAGLAAAPNPENSDAKAGAFFTSAERTWLLPRMGLNPSPIQWIGITLVVLSTLGFVLAGLGVFGVPGLVEIWRTIALVSAVISLVLLVLFWHPWLIVGVLIDLVIIISLVWADWPSAELIGQ